jgi:hypoxanthine phosphoribosyltransferase
MISSEAIEAGNFNLALRIHKAYNELPILVIPVLNGAFLFAADLLRQLARLSYYQAEGCTGPIVSLSFVKIASYEGTQSSGQIQNILGLTETIEGKHILLLEDVVDTGLTMAELTHTLSASNPASIAIAALLFKPNSLQHPVEVPYAVFEIGAEFVVGYGMDYHGLGRGLPAIYRALNAF